MKNANFCETDESIGFATLSLLGQSGCSLQFKGITIYIDPFLSNSVQELDSPDLVRLVPIPFLPESVIDADWVLITHDHIDHCDPLSLPKIAQASPQAKFIAPSSVISILLGWGIAPNRLFHAREQGHILIEGIELFAIPSAHPKITRDSEGKLASVGYLVRAFGENIYIAGDTCVDDEIIKTLHLHGPIHTALLPVNEHNYFREKRGILGNMSIREAFLFADVINTKQVIPVHWDMFEANGAYIEEILLIYNKTRPSFQLQIAQDSLVLFHES